MKKFFVLCLTFFCLTSCSDSDSSVNHLSVPESARFEVVSYQPLTIFRGLYVIRDTQTGFEYLLSSGSHDISVCPLNH